MTIFLQYDFFHLKRLGNLEGFAMKSEQPLCQIRDVKMMMVAIAFISKNFVIRGL